MLVRVHASTVTRGDAMGVRSVDYRQSRPTEFAGHVEEVGPAGTELRFGDEVFGIAGGSRPATLTAHLGFSGDRRARTRRRSGGSFARLDAWWSDLLAAVVGALLGLAIAQYGIRLSTSTASSSPDEVG